MNNNYNNSEIQNNGQIYNQNSQNQGGQYNQPPKKKSKVGWIILIVLVCLLPVIILVFIMLTSLGVLIFNNATSNVETQMSSINSIEISMQNARYESYLGEDKNSNIAIALTQLIKANNAYDTNKIDVNVQLKDGSTYTLDNVNTNIFATGSKYDITADYNKEGYINLINIKEK